MSERAFLETCGWADAVKTPLAGDASSRRYTRLTQSGTSAILMDEGPGSSEQLNRFASIARHLTTIGLSAPKVLADNSDQFLLIEDLGDALFASVIEADPTLEIPLYKAAIDALIVSQRAPIPDGISAYGPAEMTAAIDLVFEWYPTPETAYSHPQTSAITHILQELLNTYLEGDPVLIQRDFHAENLIWLPERTGPARAGLLDFQDAVYGHPAYDLASLLVDARRDVSKTAKAEMIDYFTHQTGAEATSFKAAFALCSAQRNLRILGIFCRLVIRDKKPGYAVLIPRVWRNLMADLTHPELDELRMKITDLLPEATPDIVTRIATADV